jgi:hypothetical protein
VDDLQPVLVWLQSLGPWGIAAALAVVMLWPKLAPLLARLRGPKAPDPAAPVVVPPDLFPDRPAVRALLLFLIDRLKQKWKTDSVELALQREGLGFLIADAYPEEKPATPVDS